MKKITQILTLLIAIFALCNCAYAIEDVQKNKNKDVVLKEEVKENAQKQEQSRMEADIEIQDGAILSLNDCIRIALTNSPEIKKYKNLVRQANALLGQSKASYFPSLSLGTGYYGKFNNNDGTSISDNSYGLNASLSQLIFSFGKVGAKIKKAKLNKIAADFDLNYETIKTIFNVKTNYYAVLAATANMKVQEANISVNERQYQQTKAYFEEGLKSKIDVVNAEVYLSDAKINYVTSQNTYDAAVIALNNSMYIQSSPKYSIEKLESFNFANKYAEVALKNFDQDLVKKFKAPELAQGASYQTSVQKNELIDINYKVKKFPYTLNESIALAKENRPDLRSYVAVRDALRQELKYQRIQYLPDLKAKGTYGLNATSTMTNSFQVAGTLDFTSINAMDIKYKIEEAKAKLDVADNAIDKLEKDIYFNVQTAYVNMVQLEKKIPLTEVSVKQTFENLELAMGRYEVGLGNFLEVQDAIVNYNKAQESYVKLIFDYNVARAKVELEIAKLDKPQEQKDNK